MENGFPNCILKGQGNALMYPDPYARVPGDIDIWLDGGREKILDFTTKYYNRPYTSIHVDFPMFADAGDEKEGGRRMPKGWEVPEGAEAFGHARHDLDWIDPTRK